MESDFSQAKKNSATNQPSAYKINEDSFEQLCHELNMALASMKMWLVFLEAALEKEELFNGETSQPLTGQEKVFFYVKNLKKSCEKQLSLINNWVELEQLENWMKPLNLSQIKLETWISSILERAQTQNNWRQQRFQLQLTPALPTILTDISYLDKIFSELVNHACNSTPPNTEITIKACENKGKISLTISYPLLQDRLWNKVYLFPKQTENYNQTTAKFPIAEKLANNIRGAIVVKNKVNNIDLILELPLKIYDQVHLIKKSSTFS